jgi:hypothetical protein
MPKFTGGLSQFTLGTTDYLCLNNYTWSGSVADAVAQCSGATGPTTVRRPGTPDDKFTFAVVVDSQDVTTINELKRGVIATAFEFHPEGDAVDNIEFIATGAVVLSSSLAGGPNALGILNVEIGIDGTLTIQAATA